MGGGKLAAVNVGNSSEIDKMLPIYRWTWDKAVMVFCLFFRKMGKT